jgi:hypothetical protein
MTEPVSMSEVVRIIGDDLTLADQRLQTPGMLGPDWQALYALRKHLDDIQRQLVMKVIKQNTAKYQQLTTDLKKASDDLKSISKELQTIADFFAALTIIVDLADRVLKL